MSLSKNKISYIQSLKQKKYRNQHNTFVAEGSKLILDLLPHMKCQLLVLAEGMKENVPTNDTYMVGGDNDRYWNKVYSGYDPTDKYGDNDR